MARLRRHPRRPVVRLLPGVGDELIRLRPLARLLVEPHWTRMVAEINGGGQGQLGPAPSPVRLGPGPSPGHRRTTSRSCRTTGASYCGGTLGAGPAADHLIPRIRYGVDAVENLVSTGRRCHNDKRDLFPCPPYVTASACGDQRHDGASADLATASRWDTDPQATVAAARSICSHLLRKRHSRCGSELRRPVALTQPASLLPWPK